MYVIRFYVLPRLYMLVYFTVIETIHKGPRDVEVEAEREEAEVVEVAKVREIEGDEEEDGAEESDDQDDEGRMTEELQVLKMTNRITYFF